MSAKFWISSNLCVKRTRRHRVSQIRTNKNSTGRFTVMLLRRCHAGFASLSHVSSLWLVVSVQYSLYCGRWWHLLRILCEQWGSRLIHNSPQNTPKPKQTNKQKTRPQVVWVKSPIVLCRASASHLGVIQMSVAETEVFGRSEKQINSKHQEAAPWLLAAYS